MSALPKECAMSVRTVSDLSTNELLDQYTSMVRWTHYDPMCRPQPSSFSVDELGDELLRRLGGD